MAILPFNGAMKTGYPLRMTWEERSKYADEIIAMLSAWKISRGDAEAILGQSAAKMKEITPDTYLNVGRKLGNMLGQMK